MLLNESVCEGSPALQQLVVLIGIQFQHAAAVSLQVGCVDVAPMTELPLGDMDGIHHRTFVNDGQVDSAEVGCAATVKYLTCRSRGGTKWT